jgi:hypothetical protein
MEKVFSSFGLPMTITMTNFTSFKYSNNLATMMALKAKCPHNFVVGLQSSGGCRAPWELFFMVITKIILIVG